MEGEEADRTSRLVSKMRYLEKKDKEALIKAFKETDVIA